MRRRFFVERFDGRRAVLRGDAAHHAGRVLRAEAGQLYELSDGQQVWLGRIEHVRRDGVEFALLELLPQPALGLQIGLLLSIVKFDRFEWALEKATEMGAAEIHPLAAARSEKGLVAAALKRAARWEKILFEAAQQSRRLRPPLLRPLARKSTEFLTEPVPPLQDNDELRLFFSEEREAPPLRQVLERAPHRRRVLLAFGPEGGWTEQETQAARAGRWELASLGTNILRTETAVLAALAIVNFAYGDS